MSHNLPCAAPAEAAAPDGAEAGPQAMLAAGQALHALEREHGGMRAWRAAEQSNIEIMIAEVEGAEVRANTQLRHMCMVEPFVAIVCTMLHGFKNGFALC